MAKKPETKFKEKVMPLLKALPMSWWEKIQQKSISGTPDILGCINGTFIAIELKSSIDSPITGLQKHKLELIDNAGGVALVVHPDNWNRVYNRLVKFSQGVVND